MNIQLPTEAYEFIEGMVASGQYASVNDAVIARDKPVAASNWIDLIEEKCKLIAATPAFGEQRSEFGPDTRSSMVGRYVIFYRIIDAGVEVVRVISGDRDILSI